jgi:phosphatidylserine decarboxylase
VTVLTTKSFGDLLLLEIGALGVGRINQTYKAGPVVRGVEKGYFRFGGSTVMIVAPPGRLQFDDDLVGASRDEMETLVKMGTRIGCRLKE